MSQDWQFKPARDHGLPPLQRLRSLGREHGLAGLAAHWLWLRAARGYLAAAHGLRVEGGGNLPAETPFVVVANHASHLDALALCAALRGRAALVAHPLAAGELFFGTAGASAFAAFAINALPVWRGHTRPGDLAAMRAHLVEDKLVYVLFPEGTRSRDGTMAPFQPGIGALVAGTDVPVVPCFLAGAFAAWPAHRRLPQLGRPLRLAIGPPLRFQDVPNDRAGGVEVAAKCRHAVLALAPRPCGLS